MKDERKEPIVENIFLIDRRYLCNYFLSIDIPIDIRVLILRYSGHIKIGKKSLRWTLF